MATLNQPKPAPASKYDAVVEAQLARARTRLRTLDVTVGLLGLAGGTLVYALGMVLLDRWLDLPPLARQAALLVYGAAALVYVGLAVVRPLCRRINPYYAARHIEHSVPDAKNSVVNWLDLHGKPLPPAIHSALAQRAARDLARVDLDQAISGRRAGWLGLLTGLLVVALFIALLILGPAPFYSLLGRNFAPFVEAPIATRTVLTLKEPEGGNATVAVGRSVRIAVEAEGRVPDVGAPDALRVLYHYQPGDPYEEQPLEREDGAVWATALAPFKVQNGFWYKVRGGDAETPEYQVLVRATPLVQAFEAAYHYRPYLGWRDDATHDPNLRALRGTQVMLTAHTNRPVRVPDSRLELELGPERQVVPAEPVPDDPQALRFHLVLEKDGKYRVRFLSTDGEPNSDTRSYTIQALPDHAPLVELRKPGQDVTRPANGVLSLEGLATDDIGLTGMTLRLRVEKGGQLQAKPYRAGKSFRLADGAYPRSLEYRDFVDLASLKDEAGRPVKLEPKTVLEYFLEATDNCDYPGPNVGRSKTYRVTITDPDADRQKQEQDRQKAQKEQQQHEANQDKQLDKENQAGHGDRNPDHAQQDADKPQQNPDQPNKQESKQGQGDKQPDKQNKGENQQGQQNQAAGEKDQGSSGKGQQEKKPGDSGKGQPDKKQGESAQGRDQQPGKEKNEGQQSGSGGQGADDQRRQETQKLADAIKQEQAGRKPNERPDNTGKEPNNDGSSKPKDSQGKQTGAKEGANPNSKPAGKQQPGANAGTGGERTNPQSSKPEEPKELNREPNGGPTKAKPRQPGDPETLSRERPQQPDGKRKPGGGENAGGKKSGEQPQTKEGDGADNVPPQEAKKDDVDRLAKKAQGGKREEREQATRKLQQVSQEAKDPEAREAARQALQEQARELDNHPRPGEARNEPTAAQPKESQPSGGQPKNSEGNQASEKGNSKAVEQNAEPAGSKAGNDSGPNAGDKGSTKGAGEKAAGAKPGGGEKSQGGAGSPGNGGTEAAQGGTPGGGGKAEPGNPPGTTKGPGAGQPGDQPAGGGGNGRIGPQGSSAEEPPPPPEGPAGKQSPHAGNLVLDDLRKTIEELKKHPEEMKKVLHRAGLNEKDLRDVEDYLHEKLPPPQQGGNLANIGAHRAAAGSGKTPDAQAADTALPPPGFRDSTREFTRRLAEPDK